MSEPSDCYFKIRETVTDDDIDDTMLREFDKLVQEMKDAVDPGGAKAKFKERMAQYIEERRQITARDRLLKIVQREREKVQIARAAQYADWSAGRSAVAGNSGITPFALETPENRMASLRRVTTNLLESAIDRIPGARALLESKTMESELFGAIFELGNGMKADLSKYDPLVQRIAKEVVKPFNDYLIKTLERAYGIPLGRVDNFVTKTIHDSMKMMAVGRDAWIEKILPHLDLEKTYGIKANDPEFIRTHLKEAFEKIVNGTDSEVKSRSLHWKSGESLQAYNAEFGGDSLLKMLQGRIETVSRNAATVEFFGPDPRKGLETLLTAIEKRVEESRKKGVGKFFETSFHKDWIRGLYDEVTGVNARQGHSKWFHAVESTLVHNTMRFLNNVPLRSAFGNIATTAAEIMAAQGRHNVFTAHLAAISEVLRQAPPEKMRETAKLFEIFTHQSLVAMVASDFKEARGTLANFKDAMQVWTKWNHSPEASKAYSEHVQLGGKFFFKYMLGQDAIQSRFAMATQNLLAHGLAMEMKAGGLSEQMLVNLRRSGIGQNELFVLNLAREMDAYKREVISPRMLSEPKPEMLLQVQKMMEDMDLFEKRKGMTSVKSKEKQAEEFVERVRQQYLGYLHSSTQIATTSAGAKISHALRAGFQKNSPWGLALQAVTQFKAFALQSLSIQNRIRQANPTAGIVSATGSVLSYAGTSAALWYGSQAIIQIGRGEKPDDPTKPQTWMNALYKGGGLGMLGDVWDSETSRGRSGVQTYLLGPTAQSMGDAIGIAQDFVQDRKAGKKTAAFLRNAVPFQNHLLLQHVWKPTIIDGINQGLNLDPDYDLRKELRNLKKENE